MAELAQFTYDGIPDLPDIPEVPNVQAPAAPQQFRQQVPSAANGIPKFEIVAKRNKDGSYRNVEYVTILTPGDAKSQPRHKVTDEIRQKYAQHYRLFRQGLEVTSDGTPLETWPVLTPAQIQDLKANNIFTVEQLRDTPDSNDHRIPLIRTLKNRAKQWLETKEKADVLDAQVRENENLRQGQSMLEQQLADLQAKFNSMASNQETAAQETSQAPSIEDQLDAAIDSAEPKPADPAKRGPGRPRKEK